MLKQHSKGYLINSLYLLCLHSFQYFSEQFIQIKYAFAGTIGRIFKEHLKIASNVETSANTLSPNVRLQKTSLCSCLFLFFLTLKTAVVHWTFSFESLELLQLALSWKPHLEWQEEKVYHDQETPLCEKHLITVTSTPTSLLPKCPLWPCSSNIRGCSNRKVRSTYSSVRRSKGNTPLLH